jgi:diguanylate cyclase (GGDEF)-like protein
VGASYCRNRPHRASPAALLDNRLSMEGIDGELSATGGELGATLELVEGVVEASPQAMVIADSAGKILLANGRSRALFGRDDLVGASLAELVPALGGNRPEPALVPRGIRADGTFPVDVTRSEVSSTLQLQCVCFVDLSEDGKVEERLRSLSDHDPLTGLFNRHRFEEEAEREAARAARYGGGALAVIEVEGLGAIIDREGQEAADEALREIGRSIGGRVRETDVVARLGPATFAILLTETEEDHARRALDDLVGLVGSAASGGSSGPPRLRASAGLVGLGDQAVDGGEGIRRAELALLDAIGQGGGVQSFAPELLPAPERSLSWNERIRAALRDDAFIPHFQPILDLGSDRVTHWEVLIRMIGADGEVILPESFIPSAERHGLIRELDRWVVEHAISAMAEHADRDEVCLEINLSGMSTGDPELLEGIREGIRASGVDPARIVFEVTETAAIANLDEASRFGTALRELGCGFALDDFGTGFASFYYLKRLPLTHLKIDGDFIRALPDSPVDQLVVEAIVDIAHGMGLKTIAEFAEDAATIEMLRELGVDYCQGYEVGIPLPPTPPDRMPSPWR